MKNVKMYLLIMLAIISTHQVFACSMFRINSEDKVFVTNNEDWKDSETYMWTEIGEDSFYNVIYFGFGDFFTQGGMNEMGLLFDGFATEFKEIKNQEGKIVSPNNLFSEVMKQCANCDEAYEFFSKYDVSFLTNAQMMFSDAQGKSFILEGEDFIWGDKDYQIVTNFYQSEIKDASEITCFRYKTMDRLLQNLDEVTVDNCKKIMDMVHAEGEYPTQYTNIYDPINKKIYLYLFHNYSNEIVIDLEEEFAKGSHQIKLAELFDLPYAYDIFVSRNKETLGKLLDKILTEKGMKSVEEKLTEILANPTLTYSYEADENELNNLGYRYLAEGKLDEAILVFKTNVKLFPKSWNCYDSLGEAYVEAGLYPKAIDNYKRSVQLNPTNEGGKKMLDKLLENYE